MIAVILINISYLLKNEYYLNLENERIESEAVKQQSGMLVKMNDGRLVSLPQLLHTLRQQRQQQTKKIKPDLSPRSVLINLRQSMRERSLNFCITIIIIIVVVVVIFGC